MSDATLKHDDILAPGTCAHVSRATLGTARPRGLHGHDFHEIFWVQNGTVRHHLPGGRAQLSEGTLAFLRPGDRHALQGRGADAMVVSICLHPALVAALSSDTLDGLAFWRNGTEPVTARLDPRRLADLNRAALVLEEGPSDDLATQAFLLPLLAHLRDDAPFAALPNWLQGVCTLARSPEGQRGGVSALVAAAGCSPEHLARAMRRHLGETPTAYLNARRMEAAARLLSGDRTVLEAVAEEVGLPNLSHFHKLFRATWGQTPHQFRQRHQRGIIQPE